VLRGLLVRRDEHRLPVPEHITTGEFLTRWLRDYAAGIVAPTTLASYQGVIRVHLAPQFGHIPLQRLLPSDIQAYISRRLSEGKLSSTTLRYHVVLLHEALRHAVKWELLTRNPCDQIDPPRRARHEMKVWDDEQVKVFLGEAKRSSSYYRLYLAAITTGMRAGELAGLRWSDVNLATGTVSIQQIVYRLSGSRKDGRAAQILFKGPKSEKSRRTIPLPAILVEELRVLRTEQEQTRLLLGAEHYDPGLVFCQPDGKPLRLNNITRRDFARTIKRAGLQRIRFHDLRHCHASLLLQQGVNPKVVQERLGHSSPAFTLQVYSHVLPGMQEQAVQELQARLFGRVTLKDPANRAANTVA
jgi:integrase